MRHPPADSPADPQRLDQRRLRFEEVYAANHPRILGYVLRRTESTQDAADILADTFLTAWRRLDDVPPGDGGRLWLYGVARRLLANHRRGERRRSALTGELATRLRVELSAYRPPEETADTAAIAAAFRSLPDGDRELLSLVLAMLRKRHVTVPEYRYTDAPAGAPAVVENLRPDQVSGKWYVHGAVPWAKGQLLLFIGSKPEAGRG